VNAPAFRRRPTLGAKFSASVAEPAPLSQASVAASRPGRPWLRLVRSSNDELGPVSPELALVDPPLAATVRLTPDAVVVSEPDRRVTVRSNLVESWDRLRTDTPTGDGTAVRYDTRDLLLERHGVALELLDDGPQRVWRLTAARGESVEAVQDGPGVPPRLEALLGTVIRGGELLAVPTRSSDPQIGRIEEQVGKQLHSLLRYDVGTRIGSDPESLHQLRVAGRRLRVFLSVAHHHVDGEWASEITEGMRELGRASNEARDIDILLDNLRGEIRRLDLRDQAAGAALMRRLEEDRRELQKALVALLDSPGHQRVLDRLALPVVPSAESAPRKLDRLAARELRRLVGRVRRLGKRPTDDELHSLRIKVKRVRYAAELGGAPSKKQQAKLVEAATGMQDILGEHQDALVREDRLRTIALQFDETGISFVAGRLAERERVRRTQIGDRLPPAWKELHKLARKLD
jgi:CHAD domain-containing protein